MQLILSRTEFETAVIAALAELPPDLQTAVNNVEVLIASWPTLDDVQRAGVPAGHTLLGLYNGIPLTKRTHAYNLVAPDTITLYQGPIERAAGGDPERIRRQVRRTVLHEMAHHFGISDARLHELGAY